MNSSSWSWDMPGQTDRTPLQYRIPGTCEVCLSSLDPEDGHCWVCEAFDRFVATFKRKIAVFQASGSYDPERDL